MNPTQAPPPLIPARPMSAEEFSRTARAIEAEVGRVIVGQAAIVRSVLVAVIAGRHVLLEGVPGLGKTMLIRTLGNVLRLKFARIQFTPDLQPADITGTDLLEDDDAGRKARRFQPGPVFANLVLADEINRATPKTQSALLEAMAEGTVTVSNRTYTLEAPFFVLATQNPLESEGTYPLPEAQLDRFMFKVNVPFPSAEELVSILQRTTGAETAQAQPAADGAALLAMQALALGTPVASHIVEYVARLVVATHPTALTAPPLVRQFGQYGASPRGAQALIIGAKVNALLDGRFNAAFDDVHAVAANALRHRILLQPEASYESISVEAVIEQLLAQVPKTA